MYRIDTPHKAVAKPPYSADAGGGYFQDTNPAGGTELSADFFNHVQEELCGLIENTGVLSPDKADDTLLVQAIGGAAAIKSHQTDTGNTTTWHLHSLISSATSQADGALSCVIASTNARASGTVNSCVIASAGSAVDGVSASGIRSCVIATDNGWADGVNSMIIGSNNAQDSTKMKIEGGNSLIMACSVDATADGIAIINTARNSAIIASEAKNANGEVIAWYESSFIAASEGDGGETWAIQRRNYIIGSKNCKTKLAGCGVLGSEGSYSTGTQSLIVGSLNAELHDSYSIGGGYAASGITITDANQNLKWKISSQTGDARFAGTIYIGGSIDDNGATTSPRIYLDGSGNIWIGGGNVVTDEVGGTGGQMIADNDITSTAGDLVAQANGKGIVIYDRGLNALRRMVVTNGSITWEVP